MINPDFLTSLDDLDAQLIPGLTKRLINIIGVPDTIKLLQARGGFPFTFPVKPHLAKTLPGIISNEALIALCNSDFAGTTVSLPKGEKLLNQIRNKYIQTQKNKKSARELGTKFGLGRRQVQKIWAMPPVDISTEIIDKSSIEEDDRQMRLF